MSPVGGAAKSRRDIVNNKEEGAQPVAAELFGRARSPTETGCKSTRATEGGPGTSSGPPGGPAPGSKQQESAGHAKLHTAVA
eukprot:6045155-Pyramimonas_sp.AAC.1